MRPHDIPEERLAISHSVYGLGLLSNVTLPGFPSRDDGRPPDVLIRLKQNPAFPPISDLAYFYTSANRGALNDPALRVGKFGDGRYFGFFYSDGVSFAVHHDGREVWADWPDGCCLEDACIYLRGPVLGFVLRLHGITCLHASAVAIGDQAVALMGEPEAGKSTTAAAFAKCGYAVLSDDVVALDSRENRFLVQPGYPGLNLWPDSVRALFGSEDAMPRIIPSWDKRFLALGSGDFRFETRPLPLRAIYVLDRERSGNLLCPIEETAPSPAMMTLVANTYVNYLLDSDMRHRDFDVLSRLVASVRVCSVRAPADPSHLQSFCEAIAADARNSQAMSSTSVALGRLRHV